MNQTRIKFLTIRRTRGRNADGQAPSLTPAQLRTYEAKRDLAAELLESVEQMKAGKTSIVHLPPSC